MQLVCCWRRGIAGLVLPFRRRALFAVSPTAQSKIGGVPWITVLGVIGGAFVMGSVVLTLADNRRSVCGTLGRRGRFCGGGGDRRGRSCVVQRGEGLSSPRRPPDRTSVRRVAA